MTVRSSNVLQKQLQVIVLDISQIDGSPIDDAMLEIKVLIGDAHSVYIGVGDILPGRDFSVKRQTFVGYYTWDPDQERCSQIHALSSMELEEERAPWYQRK